MIQFKIGDRIEASGRRRCIKIIGKVIDLILGGYQVMDETTELIYHVRHSDFEIKEA